MLLFYGESHFTFYVWVAVKGNAYWLAEFCPLIMPLFIWLKYEMTRRLSETRCLIFCYDIINSSSSVFRVVSHNHISCLPINTSIKLSNKVSSFFCFFLAKIDGKIGFFVWLKVNKNAALLLPLLLCVFSWSKKKKEPISSFIKRQGLKKVDCIKGERYKLGQQHSSSQSIPGGTLQAVNKKGTRDRQLLPDLIFISSIPIEKPR